MGSIKPEPKSNGVAVLPLGSLDIVFLLVFSTVAANKIHEIGFNTSLNSDISGYPLIPVVMIADLMAEGDHDGYTLFTRAATPVTWGHAMEVPDRMLKCMLFLTGDHAAKMFRPGAATSGYKNAYMKKKPRRVSINLSPTLIFPGSLVLVTFRISGVNELGPLEENAAIRGASRDPKTVFDGKIIVLACL